MNKTLILFQINKENFTIEAIKNEWNEEKKSWSVYKAVPGESFKKFYTVSSQEGAKSEVSPNSERGEFYSTYGEARSKTVEMAERNLQVAVAYFDAAVNTAPFCPEEWKVE
jgi:hypothetical protein